MGITEFFRLLYEFVDELMGLNQFDEEESNV